MIYVLKQVKKYKETFAALLVGVHQSKAILRDIYEAYGNRNK